MDEHINIRPEPTDSATEEHENTEHTTPQKRTSKKKIWILAIACILLIGSGAAFALLSGKEKDKSPVQAPSTNQTPEEASRQIASPSSVIFCSQQDESYRYLISSLETRKISGDCPSFVNQNGGHYSYNYSPNGVSYVRLLEDNTIVTATVSNGLLTSEKEKEISKKTTGDVRVMGWAGESAIIMQRTTVVPGTEGEAYPQTDEIYQLIRLDGTAKTIFKGTGGHFSAFDYIGYDDSAKKVIGCQPSVEGCRKFIIISEDGSVAQDDSYTANSPTVDFKNMTIYYVELVTRKLHAYSYKNQATKIVSTLPGYVRDLQFNAADNNIYFDSDANNQEGDNVIADANVALWRYNIASGKIEQATKTDKTIGAISIQDISLDGLYMLLWVTHKDDSYRNQFQIFNTKTNKSANINTDHAREDSFRFSYSD